jgi:hypothetical protein
LLLLKGDFANGWREMEWKSKALDLGDWWQPRWTGEDLKGRTLLLHTAEKGGLFSGFGLARAAAACAVGWVTAERRQDDKGELTREGFHE